ncbi:MAG: hypothetical protein ACK56I_19110, partial [bacterium]
LAAMVAAPMLKPRYLRKSRRPDEAAENDAPCASMAGIDASGISRVACSMNFSSRFRSDVPIQMSLCAV